MKYVVNIAAGLLGLMFLAASLFYFFGKMPDQKFVPGSYEALFNAAFFPSGYMTVVKVCELLGGILVAIPKTRNFGLLILGPVIINIICYSTLIMSAPSKAAGPLVVLAALPLFLLWAGRKKFAGLLN